MMERLTNSLVQAVNRRLDILDPSIDYGMLDPHFLLQSYNKKRGGAQCLNLIQLADQRWLCVEYVPDSSSLFNPNNMYDERHTPVEAAYLGLAVRLGIIPPYMDALSAYHINLKHQRALAAKG